MPKGIYKRTQRMRKNRTTHGMSDTRPYRIWTNMISRCTNSKSSSFKYYGNKGIKVCLKWETFANFWKDMKQGYHDNLTIDRIDSYDNYKKSNCRWVTIQVQQRNRRDATLLSYNGNTQSITEWCEEMDLKVTTVIMRIYKYNWTIEQALTTPVRKRKS